MGVILTPPSSEQVDAWIAAPRFAPFLDATEDDHTRAMQLYVWNARLASACFEVIHHLEVLVRNSMHRELKADEKDGALRSWLIDPRIVKDDEMKAINTTIKRIQQRRIARAVDPAAAAWIDEISQVADVWSQRPELAPAQP